MFQLQKNFSWRLQFHRHHRTANPQNLSMRMRDDSSEKPRKCGSPSEDAEEPSSPWLSPLFAELLVRLALLCFQFCQSVLFLLFFLQFSKKSFHFILMNKVIFFCILFQCRKMKTCKLVLVATGFCVYGSAAGPTPIISCMAVSQWGHILASPVKLDTEQVSQRDNPCLKELQI